MLKFLAARFCSPVALRRSQQTLKSLQDRAMRWGAKDADEKFNDLPAGGISLNETKKVKMINKCIESIIIRIIVGIHVKSRGGPMP